MHIKVDITKIGLLSATAASLATVVSLFVGFVSLHTSLKIQEDNLHYQELAITQDLDMTLSANDLSLYVVNDGLGPAQITEVRILYKKKCAESFDSGGSQNRDWEYKYSEIMQEFLEDTISSFGVANPEKWTVTKGISEPGTFIRPGDKRLVFQIHPPQDQNIDSIADSNRKLWDNINSKVIDLDKNLSITFRHCSISGNTCDTAGWNPVGFCPVYSHVRDR